MTATAEPHTWGMTGVRCVCAMESTLRYSRDAAERADLRLGDVEAASLEEVSPAPARVLDLAARDVGVERHPQLAIAILVLGRHRLLEPVGSQLIERAADAHGIAERVAVVGIDHEVEVFADASPDRLGQSDVLPHPEADLHLGRHGSPASLMAADFLLEASAMCVARPRA